VLTDERPGVLERTSCAEC